jgi:hypothetical protein
MDNSTIEPITVVTTKCPDCGAAWANDQTCHDHFLEMLFWENENPALAIVHHLMVLCYHLQHPRLYSADGLAYGKHLLIEFLERGTTPAQIRRRYGRQLNSRNRKWKIKGWPEEQGAYDRPVNWTMTAADVVLAGMGRYGDSVRAWARATLIDLKVSGNLNSSQ